MAIFLEPLDVWVFRDGRPFSAGEDHHARSIFPPSPFTVQGALRSKVLTERCGNLDKYAGRVASCPVCGTAPECPVREEIGTPQSSGPFRLRWVLPARKEASAAELYVPLPRHVVSPKGSNSWQFLRPRYGPELAGLPGGLRPLGVKLSDPVEHRDRWISAPALESLLAGTIPESLSSIPTRGNNGILEEEPRVGIGLERGRRTARQGQFFIVEALRLHKDWGLAVAFDGLPSLPREGFLDIGGEGRAASYATFSDPSWPAAPAEDIHRERRFLLYLVTPAFFKTKSQWGWQPGFLDDSLAGVIPGTKTRVRLVAVALGPPLRLSGWMLGEGGRGGQPRPMRPAVQAGSAYFFEVVEGSTESVLGLHGQTVTDWAAEFGFGLSLIGRWLSWPE